MDESLGDPAKCFVPEMLVEFIEKRCGTGKAGLEPASFFLDGVCLLVDISGFTKLSGEFCNLGKAGIDDLQLATNGYMGKLVEIVYLFGGEIIKFAGDAIICVFSTSFSTELTKDEKGGMARQMSNFGEAFAAAESERVSPQPFMKSLSGLGFRSSSTSERKSFARTGITADVVLRAMQCAQELRAVQTDKLSVHVAMSCGEMCFGILGGVENRWECLISGACLHELSDCLDDAPSKQAVISAGCAEIVLQAAAAQCHKVLSEDSTTDTSARTLTNTISTESGTYEYELIRLPSGNYRIAYVRCSNGFGQQLFLPSKGMAPAPELRSEKHTLKVRNLVKQFVPVPIVDVIETGQELKFIAEIREVTTMFMKWDSYDSTDKHRDLLELQHCFFAAQEILHTTGAYLRQFLVDDKGCVLIACWGMPNLSYLDNAHRALSAAAQIRRKLNKLEMACSFGITTGDVYCGTVGSAVRMEYAAIGSVVNMSARLMCTANGGILIDDATYNRLTPNLQEMLVALEPMKVKGREEPLQVYSYIATGSVQVKEKVVEDHEIAVNCKEVLVPFLDRIGTSSLSSPKIDEDHTTHRQHRAENAERQGSVTTIAKWVLPLTSPLPSAAQGYKDTMRMVLLMGKEGSGRTTVVKWVRKQAHDRRVPTYLVHINRKDAQTEYFVWRRLFQLMTPKGLFVSNEAQRTYVRALLDEIYPGAPQVGMHIGFPVLKAVLGITCTYSANHKEFHRSLGWMSRKVPSDKKMLPSQIEEVLYRVFSYLLRLQTCLVIVENMERCDEGSIKVLLELTKVATASGFLLTALSDASAPVEDVSTPAASFRTFYHTRNSFRDKMMQSSPWTRQYCAVVMAHKSVTSLKLTNYTAEEMDRMLCATLKVSTVPPEISQLVHDFSGGSYFWVREILQFIKDHGAEQFMSAIGEKEQVNNINVYENVEDLHSRPMLKRGPSFAGSPLKKGQSNRQLMKGPSFRVPTPSRVAAHPHQVQLDKLVLCRFGNLSSDAQRVLRTASIMGVTFNGAVLQGVLAPQLRSQLFECFQSLLNQRWLYQDTDSETLYQFAHPHSHQIIYELTPPSERTSIHQQIAEYMEEHCKNDKSQYGLLSFHYQQCDSDKALMYTAKAMDMLLQVSTIYDFGDCLDLLSGSVACCKSTHDVDAMMVLVNRARVAIRKFALVPRVEPPKTFLGRLFAAFTSFGHHHDHRIVPDDLSLSEKYYDFEERTTVRTAGSGSTENNAQSSRTAYGRSPKPKPASADSPALPDDLSEEKKAKRILLQQASRLYDLLSERYADLVEQGQLPAEMAVWHRALLNHQ